MSVCDRGMGPLSPFPINNAGFRKKKLSKECEHIVSGSLLLFSGSLLNMRLSVPLCLFIILASFSCLRWYAIDFFVMGGSDTMVEISLAVGADANAATKDGVTLLHLAAVKGNAAVMERLLVAGANANAATKTTGDTPLHFAVRDDNYASVEMLLAAGADANAPSTRTV